MKVIAIVQARMGSTRLPGKVMMPITDIPMIDLLLARLARATELDGIVVATSDTADCAVLATHVETLGVPCVMGSEHDVLDRYVQAGRRMQADVVVRITGDCPLVDPALVDAHVQAFKSGNYEYVSNIDPATYPDGFDIEVVSFAALEQAHETTQEPYDREHVTPYVRNTTKASALCIQYDRDLSHLRLTVDEPEDLEVIRNVFAQFAPDIHFGWEQVMDLQMSKPELFAPNSKFKRNEGEIMGSGQKLWERAKKVIPGGNMLLSKRPEMFLPEKWPAYFSRSKGCTVWDLDGNALTDMSIMGIGTNILGYGHPEVDAAVVETVSNGNMSTLNCPEEVALAERLVEIHPWADMVRFARSGGEANALAVRIARAASGRDKVAICGYHGWHDWYLSANLSETEGLDGHLLPGLEPNGVPRGLAGSVLPFEYNNISQLEALVKDHDIGVIKMEVVRNHGPKDDFLHKVRKIADDNKIVLVFDECTSGFRETFGGLHTKYGIEPDMAMFGKAMGNGYAITATIGRREVMEAAQTTFISSTFWTERIGPSAALKTLEVMERERSWDTITATGLRIRAGWQELADSHGLGIDHWGLPALTGFTLRSENTLIYKTLICQEMLKKSYLASNSVYVSVEHTEDIITRYFAALDPVFALIKECEEGRDPMSLLEGPVCHADFKRLN